MDERRHRSAPRPGRNGPAGVLRKLLQEIGERRMAPILVGYLAGGWLVLQVVDQFADRGVLPEISYRITLALVVACIPGAIVVAWFHGAKGDQVSTRLEKILLAVVAVLAIASGVGVWRLGTASGSSITEVDPDRDPRRVAVLYFDARSDEQEADMLASGLTEALIDELSAIDALSVISRNGVAPFRAQDVPPDSIGRLLRVGTIVSGTVQASADRIRVNVSMISGETGEQLDSRRLDRPRAELFDLQDELSQEVSFFLRERIGEQFELIESQAAARSVEAWEVVQRAEVLTRESADLAAAGDPIAASRLMLSADSVLGRAELLDQDWAVPPTRRGWLAYEQSRLAGFDRSEYERWIGLGLQHAERALALHASEPDALELRGTLRYWQYLLNLAGNSEETARAVREAEADLRAAIAQNSQQASAWSSLSHLLLNQGFPPEAKLAAQRSYEADPYLRTANLTLWRLFTASLDLGDDVESRRWCEEGARRFPDDQRFLQCQVRVMIFPSSQPDIGKAWELHQQVVELSADARKEIDDRSGRMWIAMALIRAGLPDSARAVARAARAGPGVDPIQAVAYLESIVQTWLGDYEEAVRQLGLWLAANPGSSFEPPLGWYWEGLEEAPQFQRLF